ncbi:MAG: hypothetical protein GY754_20800, partial [bacterium]|nr:hypothetical protein [bacterium]
MNKTKRFFRVIGPGLLLMMMSLFFGACGDGFTEDPGDAGPGLREFKVEQDGISTYGAIDWEAFSIEGNSYLAVSNYQEDTGLTSKLMIYNWDGNSFEVCQPISLFGVYDTEFFTLNGESYL